MQRCIDTKKEPERDGRSIDGRYPVSVIDMPSPSAKLVAEPRPGPIRERAVGQADAALDGSCPSHQLIVELIIAGIVGHDANRGGQAEKCKRERDAAVELTDDDPLLAELCDGDPAFAPLKPLLQPLILRVSHMRNWTEEKFVGHLVKKGADEMAATNFFF